MVLKQCSPPAGCELKLFTCLNWPLHPPAEGPWARTTSVSESSGQSRATSGEPKLIGIGCALLRQQESVPYPTSHSSGRTDDSPAASVVSEAFSENATMCFPASTAPPPDQSLASDPGSFWWTKKRAHQAGFGACHMRPVWSTAPL